MSAKALLSASVSVPPAVYVEDVFSTYLYTGNGSTQTITNGIDLAGKGGMTWNKGRNVGADALIDTSRGSNKYITPVNTSAEATNTAIVTSFNSNGFTAGDYYNTYNVASWTFRKAEKFFDIVTYTGNGSARTIAHNLGSVPGCIIVKSTSQSDNWKVYHRSLTSNAYYILLDSTAAQSNAVDLWNNTTPTSTEFSIGSSGNINTNSATYVAYLFAHDAGGFGDAGTDSVVKCGSYTGNGSASGPTVTLGWEPQWVIIKNTTSSGGWLIFDNMRGMVSGGNDAYLRADSTNTEATFADDVTPLATGFALSSTGGNTNDSGSNYIYIAIRRGPMKTPIVGTEVFSSIARTGTGTNPTTVTTNTNLDLLMSFPRTASPAAYGMCFWDKMRGVAPMLQSSNGNSETSTDPTYTLKAWLNTGFQVGADFISGYLNYSGSSYINYAISRAPGFFDVVAWTASASTSITHGLGVTPELIIAKSRSVAGESWTVYTQPGGRGNVLFLDTINGNVGIADYWGTSGPTATTFGVAASGSSNNAGNMIAYLFASCPGVSKVGSYTGTGTTKQIDCGFTAGARFVLIKRTDSTGDWYVWDTARGIISGNDPYLLLNSTAAEVTGTDYIDPLSSGFEISSTAPAAINANGGSFIFFAVA